MKEVGLGALVERTAAELLTVTDDDYVRTLKAYVNNVQALPDPSDELARRLGDARYSSGSVQRRLLVEAAAVVPSPKFVDAMCDILLAGTEHEVLERAVDVLIDCPSPRAIPALARALSYELDYDPSHELGKKAIEALAEIGSEEALAHVRRCLSSSVPGLRAEAALQLDMDVE